MTEIPLLAPGMTPSPGSPPVEWRVAQGLTPYEEAVAFMEERANAIASDKADELVWLIEHPALYTAGTSARAQDLLDPRFPVHQTGRGGQFTYHGPGQRVVYVMLDLKRRRQDLRLFVCELENWVIDVISAFAVEGCRRADRVGVWVPRPDKPRGASGQIAEDKIAAIGVRIRRWATFHGLALNIAPDLTHFSGIVPCGVAQAHLGVTSLADLGRPASTASVDAVLRSQFEARFGPVR